VTGAFLALSSTVPLDRPALLACALFAIGVLGVTCRRNVLIMLLSVEIMLNAANLVFVAFSRLHGDLTGQVFVFFSMTVAAAEVAVGLAIVIAVYRLRRTTDAGQATELHEVDYGPLPPLRLEGKDAPHAHDEHAHDEEPHEPDAPTEEPAHAGHGGSH
jgi:NADH-quinone oxidoreductase subunit K